MAPGSRTTRLVAVTAAAAATVTAALATPTTAGAAPRHGSDQNSSGHDSSSTAVPSAHSGARQSVIVVLRDQLANKPATRGHLSARRSSAHSEQAAVLRRLSGAAPTHVINYTLGNAFAATVTAAQAQALAADPAVASVFANRKIAVAPAGLPAAPVKPKIALAPHAATGAATVNPSVCSTDRTKPKLEPEALQTLNVRSSNRSAKTAAALGINGSGVTVAFIADGINPHNAGFRRTNGKSAIVDYKDFYGDGPNAPTGGAEAFGDASAIAAQGNTVYDVADYANPAAVTFPGGHCYIKIVGVAPGANVVALKAGSELLPNSAILQAIDYAVAHDHVDVLNESFGGDITPDAGSRNGIELFNDQAVAAGTTVTVSSGDAGITSTVGNPSTDPKVISTGASTDSRIYEQTGYALATRFGNGRWEDSNTSALSSAGVTQAGRTIDVEAPGEADWALCDSSGNFGNCTSFGNPAHPFVDIQSFGGTSQSAPLTAGVAALVIQAYRRAHAGTSPTPLVVKRIITSTARDLDLPGSEQGSGLIDARAAVEAALRWPGAKKAAARGTKAHIVLSTNQRTVSGTPGTTRRTSFAVTNLGTKTQSVVTNLHRFALLSRQNQNVAIARTSASTTPYPTTGAPWAYKKVTFDVPTGADELAATIRWRSGAKYGDVGPVVRMSLFDPSGAFASNTRPQGGPDPANYGLITTRQPAAGTWTAVLYTNAATGFTGNVALTTETYRALPVGSASPVVTKIKAGKTAQVTLAVHVPSVGGDTVYTASVADSAGHRTAVPVVVRSVVSPASGHSRFAGVVTGGNARGFRAQTFTYSVIVPRGKRDMVVGVRLAHDPSILLQGILVDPHGEVQSINSNQSENAKGATVQGATMQNTVAAPIAGIWRYVVQVISPVSGRELREPFTGTVGFNEMRVTVPTLPRTLRAGSTKTVKVTVRNGGIAPLLLQTDARSGRARTIALAPQFASSTIPLPLSVDDLSAIPAYLVPPMATSVSLTSASTVPAQVELSSTAYGIDVFGDLRSARNGSTVSTATVSERTGYVGLGYWSTYLQEIGPFGLAGAAKGSSQLTATAVMQPFDPAVTSSTGDPFRVAVNATARTGTPTVIAPGASGTITVTIKPTVKGRHVGTLNLVTPPIGVTGSGVNNSGEVLAQLPYHYTVS